MRTLSHVRFSLMTLTLFRRPGTANRILEAKEKERAKDSEGGNKRSRCVVFSRVYELSHIDY